MTETVLILGKHGQVGRHLVRRFPDAIAWGREELDLSSSTAVYSKIEALQPDWVINASAYTAVDRAESEEALAMQVNGDAVGELAKACGEFGSKFVHFSTDYVFDGKKTTPYVESDATNPLNAYGRSKLAGELQTAANCEHYWIFRTSWVFSEYAPNFVKTMLRVGAEHAKLNVVNDQYGKPTYAGELARITQKLVREELKIPSGIHHLACPDETNWHDFALAIFDEAQVSLPGYQIPALEAVAAEDYATDAVRPVNSVLQTSEELGVHGWQKFLPICVV